MNKLQTAIEALEECLYDHANGKYRGAVSKAQRERVIAMFKELMAQEPVQKVFGGIIDPTYCGVTVAPAPQAEPVAWADDNAMQGKVGNVCSTAAKRYWEKSDWVDKKNAELHKHPLYVSPVAVQAVPTGIADAYAGAREDLAIWKRRALEAEELNRKFAREVNGATFMGEPAPKAVPAVTDEMVNRFLCWKFPHDFYPDGGISFTRFTGPADMRHEFKPIGTNLLNADQARAMLEHVLAAAPVAKG